jgi:myo-inositol-1(or 4)-monophosphatase
MIDFDRLEAIVHQAGQMALSRWPGHGHALEVWDKTPGNPVCEADIAVDTYLKRELHALLPSAGWLSEETVDHPERLERGLCWLVDPIDGTRDFVRGRPGWAVSVALVSGGRPLIGMMSAPARDEFWRATAGKGATRNGVALHASSRTELPGSRVPADALAESMATWCWWTSPIRSRCALPWSPPTKRTCWPRCAGASDGMWRPPR